MEELRKMYGPGYEQPTAVLMLTGWLTAHPGQMDWVIFNVFKVEDRAYYEEELK